MLSLILKLSSMKIGGRAVGLVKNEDLTLQLFAEAVAYRAKEEEEKKQAEERRKKELEAMSPEEREIAEISDPSILEDLVVEIYNGIDEFSEENKKKLAEVLKQYWETHGKWEKGSKKQLLKVQKIKGILGEY